MPTITLADLDRLIPQQTDPGRTVATDSPPPYEMGDLVAVLVHDFVSLDATWVPGTVLKCNRPDGSRRFVARVAIGNSTHCPVTIERAYCWEDGSGEGIERLDENEPGEHLDRLNHKAPLVAVS